MIPQAEISKLAYRQGMSDKVIEKDYVITWILLALADSRLKEFLVFKGGTALKKFYFPDYRYSEDLDFTLRKEIASEDLITRLNKTLDRLAKEQGFQFDIPSKKIEERADSLTVYMDFVGPLQARLGSRNIKVDFTLSEKLIFPIESKEIHSRYSDAVQKKVCHLFSGRNPCRKAMRHYWPDRTPGYLRCECGKPALSIRSRNCPTWRKYCES